jgi:anti-sigma-K factor RskA/putative zinc finger protein
VGEDRNRRGGRGELPEGHAWTREMLGPYVLGALDPEEEESVERHLEECEECRDEERGLRETHQRLAGASIASSSAPPDLKARVLDALPGSERGRWTVRGTGRAGRWSAAAAAVLILLALAVVANLAGPFGRAAETADLAPTELAPGAGGELELRGSGPNARASLEVWGLPETGPNEYYQLWLGGEGGRVGAGTFAIDDGGRGEISTLCPEVVGGYERAGITLERFPEEPSIDSARVVLRGDLPES